MFRDNFFNLFRKGVSIPWKSQVRNLMISPFCLNREDHLPNLHDFWGSMMVPCEFSGVHIYIYIICLFVFLINIYIFIIYYIYIYMLYINICK